MKVSKRQLRRIIKEEKRKLLKEITPGAAGIAAMGGGTPADQGFAAAAAEGGTPADRGIAAARADDTARAWTDAVKDAILELFVMQGEVQTTDVFEHLTMNGMHQDEIDVGIDGLNEEY